jgi:uncharacterized protein
MICKTKHRCRFKAVLILKEQLMPIVTKKDYFPPKWALNGMVETIVPALFRPIPSFEFKTEIHHLPDSDVVPLNWLKRSNKKLVVLVPGLESNSTRSYIKNISYYLSQAGFDVLVIDHRGCRIPNKVFRSYHSGNSEDLKEILNSKVVSSYEKIYLIGFSLGGNIVLKYLGEYADKPIISKAASVCAPFDLVLCSKELETKKNRIFQKRFVRSLKKSLLVKHQSFPDKISPEAINACKTLWDVDDLYTAPVHGFENALDYYTKCSSKNFLKHISVPTLLINAKNDPLIPLNGEAHDLINNNHLRPIFTDRGGHLGYPTRFLKGINFYEKVILEFFME